MSRSVRYIAPAGSPIGLADLWRWGLRSLPGAQPAEVLRDAIRRKFGVRHVVLTSTGRAGLTVLLSALRRLAPARDEVILPSYTCYSVAASVVKAGLKIRLVDVSPDTLDYRGEELEAAPYGRVLAVVATNLYGYPNDMRRLGELARTRGAFLVDDAAQAMGAFAGGMRSGTCGDVGLFSFDKGKSISAVDGGVVITDSDALASALDAEMSRVPQPGLTASIAAAGNAFAYFALLRPWLYGVPARIPQLGLGRTVYTTAFPLEHPPRVLSALAAAMLPQLDQFTRARTARATALLDELATIPGVQRLMTTPGSVPGYVRLPLIVADGSARDRILQRLNAAGIGASASYPASLADVSELHNHVVWGTGDARGGRYVARHILTLPTHPFVTPSDIRNVARTIATAVEIAGADSARRVAIPGHAPSRVK